MPQPELISLLQEVVPVKRATVQTKSRTALFISWFLFAWFVNAVEFAVALFLAVGNMLQVVVTFFIIFILVVLMMM